MFAHGWSVVSVSKITDIIIYYYLNRIQPVKDPPFTRQRDPAGRTARKASACMPLRRVLSDWARRRLAAHRPLTATDLLLFSAPPRVAGELFFYPM